MQLNPVKSTHEGNWLHFTTLYGGMFTRFQGVVWTEISL